jgi:hypothetical protein
MVSRPAEAVPEKTAKSAQRVVSDYSATLAEVFRTFPQLFGKYQGMIQNVLSAKDKLPNGIILPPVTIAPSLNMSRPSATTKIPLASAYPQL